MGKYAFSNNSDKVRLRFKGAAPEFEGDSWFADGITIYYSRLDPSWKAVREICVDEVNWHPYTVEKTFIYVPLVVVGIAVLGVIAVVVYKREVAVKEKEQQKGEN